MSRHTLQFRATTSDVMTIADIEADFSVLDDWEDRYRYVIELGRALPVMPDELRTESNKVRGCASQVWLHTTVSQPQPRLTFQGDSDALIVRGLVAILLAIYDGKTADEIVTLDAQPIFARLGLKEHLTPQRSNGLVSMIGRVKADAEAALAASRSNGG
jgi:cysteine desulfuration protein SufE